MPEATPAGFVQTPEEEFAVHRIFLDRAAQQSLKFVSLIWHPWSLYRFGPDMRMLDLAFRHVRMLGLGAGTYAELLAKLTGPAP